MRCLKCNHGWIVQGVCKMCGAEIEIVRIILSNTAKELPDNQKTLDCRTKQQQERKK